jgi:hypothetical protein
LLAAIGRVESNHGQFAGAVLRTDGTSTPPIIGIALNGRGTALVPATALGITLDGDTHYDHAIGPMQIIPSTWVRYAVAATGHSSANPFNIFDAAATAAGYLCRAGGDLSTLAGQQRAVFSYNHLDTYVSTVLSLEAVYAGGQPAVTAAAVAALPAPTQSTASVPPANPGPPPAIGLTQPTDPGSASSSASSTSDTSSSQSPSNPTSPSGTSTTDNGPSVEPSGPSVGVSPSATQESSIEAASTTGSSMATAAATS